MAEIALKNITKTFGHGDEAVAAVDDLTLTINEREFFSLLGPSGCGKTTTLRMIAGFETPTKGEVVIGGTVMNDVPPNRRRIGIVFQNYALFPHLTVFENCAFGLRARKTPVADIKKQVDKVLSVVHLTETADRRPSQLSGGQQQRVAIARSLAIEPQILLFDEPLSNLDAKLRVEMRGELVRLQRELGITAVYVTHDQEEALAISDRIAVLNEGRLEQAGEPWELYEHPATRFVADFMGRANQMEVTVVEKTADGLRVRTADGAELTAGAGRLDRKAGDTLWVTTKAEKIRLFPAGSSGDAADCIPCTIADVQYVGSKLDVAVALQEDVELSVSSEPRPELRSLTRGDGAEISIPPGDLFAL